MENRSTYPISDLTEKAAFGLLKCIEDNLPEGTKFSGGGEEVVIEALTQHGEHLSTHEITQKTLDPLKITCWVCGSVLKRLEKDEGGKAQGLKVVMASLEVLQGILLLETNMEVCLPKNEERLIARLVIEEFFGDANHGIGVNGLYLAFHCAVVAHGLKKS